MTALASSPVCFGGGTVLNVLRGIWLVPPPLAADVEDGETEGTSEGRHERKAHLRVMFYKRKREENRFFKNR